MGKLSALMSLFYKGSAVVNPEAWKTGQVSATALTSVLLATVELARAYGVDIPVSTDQAAAIAAGVIALLNIVLHVVRHEDVGLQPRAAPDVRPAGDGGPAAKGPDFGDSGGA